MQRLRRVLYVVIPVLILWWGWSQRYDILDWYRLRGYEPPARIVSLADQTTMTEMSRRIFYANHPKLNDKTSFNQNCKISEQSIVLGCYVTGKGIYVFDVTDDRLAGIHQVTAAHEMLHAAYERLSRSDRQRIDELTSQVLQQLDNERIKKNIEAYRQRDPGIIPNELHSIIATEVEQLPSELELYYQRYFKSRQIVVGYSRQYEAAFSEREAKIAEYESQLTEIKSEIEVLKAALDQQQVQIEAERQQLDQLASTGHIDRYNQAIEPFNNRVRKYNSDIRRINELIDDYNRIHKDYEAVIVEENEILKAIDSRPAVISPQ